jgi:hypothetical protein
LWIVRTRARARAKIRRRRRPHNPRSRSRPTSTALTHTRPPLSSTPAPSIHATPEQKTKTTKPKTRLIAHGKKVARVRLAGVRLADICDAVVSPQVPHSLRLQGILVNGICVVFQRQQGFLLGGLTTQVGRENKNASPAPHPLTTPFSANPRKPTLNPLNNKNNNNRGPQDAPAPHPGG